VSAPYDHEALWLKAKLFLNKAMDDDEIRSFDEQALWASLALELLAKAALARQSPLLIAVPTEDGTNVLIALGLIGGKARFESVAAKTLYSRCEKAFKPFSKAEAEKITHARNEYLHGATAEFTLIPEAAWWPRYWAQAVILVAACDREVEDLVGDSRATVVRQHLEQNKKNVEHRTEMLLERARQRLAQYEAGTLPAKVAREWQPGRSLTASLGHSQDLTCPACGRLGIIEGGNISDVDTQYERIDEDDYDVIVTLTVDSEYFSCPHCGLVLDDYQLLAEAGIDATFEAEGDSSDIPYEGEYGND
jgi:ribosomal protein S15P/S13E